MQHEDQRSSPQKVSEGWMLSMSICSPDALMERCSGDRMNVEPDVHMTDGTDKRLWGLGSDRERQNEV